MFVSKRIESMLRRDAPHKDFPPVAENEGMLFLEDTDKRSYFGVCLWGEPLIGLGSTNFEQIRALCSANYPGDTFIQFQQLSIPFIDSYAHAYLGPKLAACQTSQMMRDDQRASLREITRQQAEFFIAGKDEPHIRSTNVRLHRVIQMLTIKVPVSSHPSDEEIERSIAHIEKFEQSVATAGFSLTRAPAARYLWLLRMFFNPYSTEPPWYDDLRELREQVLPPGFIIDNSATKQLRLGDTYVKVLSPKKFPPAMSPGYIDMLQGEPAGINNQIPVPWALTLTLRLPERNRKAGWIETRFKAITFQASHSNIVKWVPRLGQKKADADLLKSDLDNGEAPCEMCLTQTLYARDQRELDRVSAMVTTYSGGLQLAMVEDSEILWPLFWNQLPLYPSDTSIKYMERHWTMSIRQALQAMPCTAEWTGTHEGATLLYETRRGLPFCYDLYATPNNFNAMVFAQSGSGKTFLTQHIITNYLSEGARVWVVDIGRGYYKLAKALGGEFWAFNESSTVCLNPFTNVEDIDEEMDLLVALLEKMSAPVEGLNDYLRARMQEAIKAVWSSHGNAMTITDIMNWLSRQPEEDVQRLAQMLHPFTETGQYGVWFEGENNLNFTSNLIVLELEELTQKPLLQQVVLMILMAKIQHDMFLEMSDMRKLAVFDESWALFDDPGVARFLNHAFRRFRRYNGSAIVVFQDIADVYLREDLRAVAANAATKIILNQMPESIDRAVASGHLALDPYGVNQLKKVHTAPDVYSEVMFMQGSAWSIARLVLPRHLQVLFSSKGAARNAIIEAVEAGVPVHEAIQAFIAYEQQQFT